MIIINILLNSLFNITILTILTLKNKRNQSGIWQQLIPIVF